MPPKITITINLIIYFFIILLGLNTYGQDSKKTTKWESQVLNNPDLSKEEFKDSLLKYDLGSLWTNTDNSLVRGFIGSNYQRIRVKIISAEKDKNNPDTYLVYGKSMVKNNVCQFSGKIKITTARTYREMHWGVDDEYKNKGIKTQGVLTAEYHFAEDSTQSHSGIFDGLLSTSWYVDKNGNIKYDDIERNSDSYCNNQFAGTWKQYNSTLKMTCNWGDFRIPNSRDLDIGDGEFSPDDKYLKNGWQNYRDAWDWDKQSGEARKEEKRQWWE